MATRINGSAMSLKFGTLEVKAEAGKFSLENEEKNGGYKTFADINSGGARQWFITIEALTATDATSWWSFLWDNTGEEVAFTFSPHGNTTASTNTPLFTGTAVVGAKPGISGEGNGDEWSFEYRLEVLSEPVLDRTP